MLPFGSITSIVPLFVLAFAYILYFGATSLNKNNADENKATEEKVLYAQGADDTFLPDFRSLDDPGTAEIINPLKFYPFHYLVQSVLRLPPGGNTSALHGSNRFSPRPPPIQI